MTCIACTKCGVRKPPDAFHKNSAAPGGLRLECKPCRQEKAKEYYASNPAASKRRSAAWQKRNRDRARASQRKYAEKHRDRRRATCRAWQRSNRAKDAARSAKQRAALVAATPSWASSRYIQLFYEIAQLEQMRTGRSVHVDHIYPLTSNWVCGLHVEDNLQLLFAEDNVRKRNHRLDGGGLSQ